MKRPWLHPEFWPVAVLAALWLLNAALTPNFAHLEYNDAGRLCGVMVDILFRGAPVGLLAIGMMVVIATKGIDFSVGSVMAMAGAVAAQGMVAGGWSPWLAVAVALAVSVALGLWNGLLVAGIGMQPIVATLILLVAGRGFAQLVTDGQIITFEDSTFQYLSAGAPLGVPFAIWLVAGVSAAVWLLLRLTAIGMYVEAVGNNERAARLCGVRVRTVKVFVYVLCGLCAGLAGLIATRRTSRRRT